MRRVLVGIVLATPLSVFADTLLLARTAALHEGLEIREALKSECDPQTEVPLRIKAALEQRAHTVLLVDTVPPQQGDLSIGVEITSLKAPGGGGWNWQGYGHMGLKQITVQTTLYDKQDVVDQTTRTVETAGGAFKYFRSTCGILMRGVDKLALDTSGWLEKKIDGVHFQRGDDKFSAAHPSP